ncbi:unnamed protein product [Chilo suppressalis]|uniref:Uncharacterized protein n=1 Tax=Chilo suppressalis TaxID=168631 RepID=A0ABN8B078_CHISP|nr:unnamed protein product [Chilo suppressalis]
MTSFENWKTASSPNYGPCGNVDKIYPYSEVPFIGQYKLVQIPRDSQLIDLVDYWGEGRIKTTEEGISGFIDCYNVNHPHQCVSNGPDRGRKIPNRVPVLSYTTCDTSSYIKENSVRIVTLMGAPINNSCAKDIARMVSKSEGKVVVYGFKRTSADIRNLESELAVYNFIHCADHVLPRQLNDLTLYDNIRNSAVIKNDLKQNICFGKYESAVELCKSLLFSSYCEVIYEVVNQLLEENCKNVMNLAYKLWNSDAQSVVINHFPCEFKAILNEDFVTIVNKKNSSALKLAVILDGMNDRRAWGDGKDKTSKRIVWQLYPVWRDSRVIFKLLNYDCGMFLKLAAYEDSIKDREAWGAYGCPDVRHMWYLEPVVHGGELLFFIINGKYGLGLKLAVCADSIGDRTLWGHSTDVRADPGYFGWYIKPIN